MQKINNEFAGPRPDSLRDQTKSVYTRKIIAGVKNSCEKLQILEESKDYFVAPDGEITLLERKRDEASKQLIGKFKTALLQTELFSDTGQK